VLKEVEASELEALRYSRPTLSLIKNSIWNDSHLSDEDPIGRLVKRPLSDFKKTYHMSGVLFPHCDGFGGHQVGIGQTGETTSGYFSSAGKWLDHRLPQT
jgi:hypothetical protein